MKKQNALYILALALCLILAAFIFNIPAIKSFINNLGATMQSPYILISAAICAFLFINTRNYWLIILGCGIIASLVIQFAIIGHSAGIYIIAVRALAFVTIVYILNLIKAIFAK